MRRWPRAAAQRRDYAAAIAFAREQPGVDATRIVLWGFSIAGDQVAFRCRTGVLPG